MLDNPTLQAKLEQILQQLTDKTQTHQSGVHFDRLSVVERNLRIRANEQDALKAILATVSKHLPEKKDTTIYKGSYTLDEMDDPINNTHGLAYCNGINAAITEMEKKLEGSV